MNRTAVVLAAGRGSRAWPFSNVRNKTIMPVLGKPLLARLVDQLQACGVSKIVVVVGHMTQSVASALRGHPNIHFVSQLERLGSAHAALVGLKEVDTESAIICYGDIVTTENVIRNFANVTSQNDSAVRLLTARDLSSTTKLAHVSINSMGKVEGLTYQAHRTFPCFAGMLVGKTALLRKCLMNTPAVPENCGVGSMPPFEADLVAALDMMAQDKIDIEAHLAEDFIVDVDKPWQLAEANHRASASYFHSLTDSFIADGASISDKAHIDNGAKLLLMAGAKIGPGCRVRGSLLMLAESQLDSGAIVRPNVILGSGTICRDYCVIARSSVMGSKCVIGHGAEFAGLMFDASHIDHPSSVAAVVGSHVAIGAGTVTADWRFDDRIREQNINGAREVPRTFGEISYIGDHTRIGGNVTFMPGIRIGSYSCVGPGAIISSDIPDKTMLLVEQQQRQTAWGPENYGW